MLHLRSYIHLAHCGYMIDLQNEEDELEESCRASETKALDCAVNWGLSICWSSVFSPVASITLISSHSSLTLVIFLSLLCRAHSAGVIISSLNLPAKKTNADEDLSLS